MCPGVLVKLNKKQLQRLGKYENGYAYILVDFSDTVLILKPSYNAKHHVYVIPNMHKILPKSLAFAIYELLHEEDNERSSLIIKDEKTGDSHNFDFIESPKEIHEKVMLIQWQ